MATDDKKSAQDKQAELEKEEYYPHSKEESYPHSIVEEEIIIEGVIDDDDNLEIGDLEEEGFYTSSIENTAFDNTALDDTPIDSSSITDGPLKDASLDDAALEYIHSDKKDKMNDTDKLYDSSDIDDSTDKNSDNKYSDDTPDYISGDGDKIEELDDKIVAETNELLKEKRAHKKNCGCHH
ncbi:hypothetical protein [Parabacteroides pacaensis]|uniref:hypothetical protein n=1 Tax=Parabacteroides pacaensis TaxID=2086575 RepID=UPI00131E8D7A|nr:hypothetical protein [Parabacteroides pacaensis]